MLLMNAIRKNNSLLDGPLTTCVVRHNTTALQNELYLCIGKMITLSIVHGGPGPSFFAESVVDYIFNGLGSVSASVCQNSGYSRCKYQGTNPEGRAKI